MNSQKVKDELRVHGSVLDPERKSKPYALYNPFAIRHRRVNGKGPCRRGVLSPRAIEDIRNGRMIILVDDEGRENEGDLCCAAETVTCEIINFMATHGRGLICLFIS